MEAVKFKEESKGLRGRMALDIQSKGGQKGGFGLRTYQVEGKDRGAPPMMLSVVLVSASQSAHALAASSSSSFALSSWCAGLFTRRPAFPLCGVGVGEWSTWRRAHNGFVEGAGVDEGKVHLEKSGSDRGRDGVRVCKCARKPGGKEN